jgi:hypothetical protein
MSGQKTGRTPVRPNFFQEDNSPIDAQDGLGFHSLWRAFAHDWRRA